VLLTGGSEVIPVAFRIHTRSQRVSLHQRAPGPVCSYSNQKKSQLIYTCRDVIFIMHSLDGGHAVAQLFEALHYKP